MKTLVIIRGLPGSGKSTLAKALAAQKRGFHFEADTFFDTPSGYRFDAGLLKDAHAWCLREVTYALAKDDAFVIVSNTFTQHWEMRPYHEAAAAAGAAVWELTTRGPWESIHGVPSEAIERMRQRWED